MNILGIDFGAKNIGLAWTDSSIGVVLPYGIINIKNQISKIKYDQLLDLIKSERIDRIVVGLPLGLDGKENENTGRVRKFAGELKKNISTPIEFTNEMLTSRQADRLAGGASRDEKAAMIILEDYLDKMSS